jgi:site-specific recombinase XerD
MRTHRGLTETTLDVYQGILAGLLDTLGDEVGAYSAEALRTFVLERARPHGIWRAKSIVVAVRSFVRFLGVTGRCPGGLEHALPGFASWQLASVPRFLSPQDLERVIGSCDGSRFELRDRAVLLLLARLGLGAREVAQLKFAGIDWRHGSLTVCGKGRRQASLPLPQAVGDAIALYLQQGRPALQVPKGRPLPYIYAPEEIGQLVAAARRLRESYPLRRQVYATMLGLIAASRLRLSEALNLRLEDVLAEGVLPRHSPRPG